VTCGLRSYPTTEVVRARTRRPGLSIHIWHLVEGQGCRRQAAYRGAHHEVQHKREFRAEKAYAFWEPIFKTGGTAREDADPHFRSRHVKLAARALASDLTEAETPARTAGNFVELWTTRTLTLGPLLACS